MITCPGFISQISQIASPSLSLSRFQFQSSLLSEPELSSSLDAWAIKAESRKALSSDPEPLSRLRFDDFFLCFFLCFVAASESSEASESSVSESVLSRLRLRRFFFFLCDLYFDDLCYAANRGGAKVGWVGCQSKGGGRTKTAALLRTFLCLCFDFLCLDDLPSSESSELAAGFLWLVPLLRRFGVVNAMRSGGCEQISFRRGRLGAACTNLGARCV